MTPEEYAEQEEQARMRYDEITHSLYSTLDSMNEDQLKVVGNILHAVQSSGRDHALGTAAYWNGVVQSKRAANHGVCLACGKKHDDELAAMLDPETPSA